LVNIESDFDVLFLGVLKVFLLETEGLQNDHNSDLQQTRVIEEHQDQLQVKYCKPSFELKFISALIIIENSCWLIVFQQTYCLEFEINFGSATTPTELLFPSLLFQYAEYAALNMPKSWTHTYD